VLRTSLDGKPLTQRVSACAPRIEVNNKLFDRGCAQKYGINEYRKRYTRSFSDRDNKIDHHRHGETRKTT
jgi:hypothetical protein